MKAVNNIEIESGMLHSAYMTDAPDVNKMPIGTVYKIAEYTMLTPQEVFARLHNISPDGGLDIATDIPSWAAVDLTWVFSQLNIGVCVYITGEERWPHMKPRGITDLALFNDNQEMGQRLKPEDFDRPDQYEAYLDGDYDVPDAAYEEELEVAQYLQEQREAEERAQREAAFDAWYGADYEPDLSDEIFEAEREQDIL